MTSVDFTAQEREVLMRLVADYLSKPNTARHANGCPYESAMLKLAKAHFGGGDPFDLGNVKIDPTSFGTLGVCSQSNAA